MRRRFALVDCNNFFVSCERVFRPDLEHKPVLVLSNNDGCVISRSDEVKAMGVPMGVPFFKVRELCHENGVHVFSSNFALYGDMSRRVDAVLEEFAPAIENYSIDESFLDLSAFPDDELETQGRAVRHAVRRWTGMPVCIGVAPTMTLAKLANWVAKTRPAYDGVVDLSDAHFCTRVLATVPVDEIWGVGRASAEKLRMAGIRTAAQLAQANTHTIRRMLGVQGARTVTELRGVACADLVTEEPMRKGIQVTRSFGRPVAQFADMRETVARYAARAAEKLRSRKLEAGVVTVFIRTGPFKGSAAQGFTGTVHMIEPTANTTELVRGAAAVLERIWRNNRRYTKAGVCIGDIHAAGKVRSLFGADDDRPERLMRAMDAVNARQGADTLRPASTRLYADWLSRKGFRSPRYTTSWTDLPRIAVPHPASCDVMPEMR